MYTNVSESRLLLLRLPYYTYIGEGWENACYLIHSVEKTACRQIATDYISGAGCWSPGEASGAQHQRCFPGQVISLISHCKTA